MGTTTTTSNQTFNQNSTEYGSSKPVLDENSSYLRNWLYDALRLRAGTPSEATGAFATQGLQNINKAGDAKTAMIQRLATARGLGRTSLGGNAVINSQADRINEGTNFLNTEVPRYAEDMSSQRLKDLAGFVMTAPVGQETYGTQNSSGNSSGTTVQKTPLWQDLMGIASYLGGSFLGGKIGGKK